MIINLNVLKSPLVLTILDLVFSGVVVGPAVVGYWRGTWNLIGHYFNRFAGDELTSDLISLVIGFGGLFVLCLLQDPIKRALKDTSRATFLATSWCYTAVCGFVCVNSWRGAWLVGDLYAGQPAGLICGTTAAAVLIMAGLKVLKTITSPPCVIILGDTDNYFDIQTYFKESSQQKSWWFVMDSLFSVVLVGMLVVVIWRGVWDIIDLTLYPNNSVLSALTSLAIGYAIVVLTFTLEPLIRWACTRLRGAWRYLLLDAYLFFSFLGTLNVWRSLWMLYELYFLPEHPLASNWITHGVSLLLLLILNCANSLLARGVCLDLEQTENGEFIILPVKYLRLYFQEENVLDVGKNAAEEKVESVEKFSKRY